eukprot:CAMPEP_0167750918 /NCGR_PEP_ID=MMETSP0110_2-20121227/6262_1 /TAXON_ID=629695 /ORGANISM="Gymnochlora sp., Strain CCMP2014" /LENGTH=60 /DNA_ID=CAMNT_0007636301 /DNA_START=161 /DNA_END=343 /DNA_ORIENTATION=-
MARKNELRRVQALTRKQIQAIEAGARPENRAERLGQALKHVGPWAPDQKASDNTREARDL